MQQAADVKERTSLELEISEIDHRLCLPLSWPENGHRAL
jgi:hypothetical protein